MLLLNSLIQGDLAWDLPDPEYFLSDILQWFLYFEGFCMRFHASNLIQYCIPPKLATC